MNNKLKISAVCLLFSCFSVSSAAQNLKDVKLSNKFSLLNDRFFLEFPAESKNNGRDASNEKHTFIDVYYQDVMIHFSAKDIFKVGSNKLFTNISESPLIFIETTKLLTTENGLQPHAIMITPEVYDTVLRSVIVNTLLVKTKDNALMKIEVKINQNDFPKKNMVKKLSEQIFQTITNGARLVNLKARVEKRKVPGTQKSFVFNLPENYVLEDKSDLFNAKFNIIKYDDFNIDNKDEFVFNIRKATYVESEDFSYHQYEQWGEDLDEVKVKGKFLSEKIEWLTFDLFKHKLFLKEQIIECTQLGRNYVVHISMVSENQKSIKEMTKISEAIAIE